MKKTFLEKIIDEKNKGRTIEQIAGMLSVHPNVIKRIFNKWISGQYKEKEK